VGVEVGGVAEVPQPEMNAAKNAAGNTDRLQKAATAVDIVGETSGSTARYARTLKSPVQARPRKRRAAHCGFSSGPIRGLAPGPRHAVCGTRASTDRVGCGCMSGRAGRRVLLR
jgi:hypothetical protein